MCRLFWGQEEEYNDTELSAQLCQLLVSYIIDNSAILFQRRLHINATGIPDWVVGGSLHRQGIVVTSSNCRPTVQRVISSHETPGRSMLELSDESVMCLQRPHVNSRGFFLFTYDSCIQHSVIRIELEHVHVIGYSVCIC